MGGHALRIPVHIISFTAVYAAAVVIAVLWNYAAHRRRERSKAAREARLQHVVDRTAALQAEREAQARSRAQIREAHPDFAGGIYFLSPPLTEEEKRRIEDMAIFARELKRRRAMIDFGAAQRRKRRRDDHDNCAGVN